MKKYIMFFMSIGLLLGIVLFYNTMSVEESKKVLFNESGYILASEDTKTNIDGVFVAGDVRVKMLRQLTTAVSDGSQAAVMACNYINNNEW